MDNIEKIIMELKKEKEKWKWVEKQNRESEKFSSKFLETTGEIFEKHGFGTTKLYLINQSGKERNPAKSLLKVIEILERYPEIINNRAIGRYIIKSLNEILREG
jgi:hypothetical protein